MLDDLNLDLNEGPTNVDRRHNLVISGQALVPKTHGLTVAWVARALSGSHVHACSIRRPIPIATGRSPSRCPPAATSARAGTRGTSTSTAGVTARRAPASFRLDLRLGYRVRAGTGRSLDLFVDVFNITNRANFENPTGDRRSTDFLNLTALRAGAVPTTAQIGVRMQF